LNKLTPVRNQGSCGSCWTFGTAGFFESDLVIYDNESLTLDLSEQYLTSCQNRSHGCNGGYPFSAM
jgi:C1A family cysteine protease